MAQYAPAQGPGYGKRPLWQWLLIYLVIGAIVYGAVYYFVYAKRGDSVYNSDSGETEQQTTQEFTY